MNAVALPKRNADLQSVLEESNFSASLSKL